MLARALITLGLTLTLAGCFPMRIIERPAVSGSVVDDSTSRPVPNAVVILRLRTSSGRITDTTSATSDSGGAFLIPAVHKWIIYIVPMDFIGYLGTVDFAASGFAVTSRDIHSSPEGPAEIRLGDVRLKRAQ